MVFVGIDVAKDKHDCFAVDSDGVVRCDGFTFANSASGFAEFLSRALSWGKIKVGMKATCHYSLNLLHGFFSNIYGNTALTLLAALPSAKDISECNVLTITKILASASHGRLKRNKADSLKSLAKDSIASYNYGDAFELRQATERIRFLASQLSDLESEISKIMLELDSPITSIPGIGNLLGATILSEIGDVSLFANPDKLLAFAGCEPSTYQSGKYVANNTPMVKHGSRYLRRALYCAADMAYVHCPSFRAYIDRKRSQGKHFYVAMSHGMKKLVRIIFAVLSRNIPFSEPA